MGSGTSTLSPAHKVHPNLKKSGHFVNPIGYFKMANAKIFWSADSYPVSMWVVHWKCCKIGILWTRKPAGFWFRVSGFKIVLENRFFGFRVTRVANPSSELDNSEKMSQNLIIIFWAYKIIVLPIQNPEMINPMN